MKHRHPSQLDAGHSREALDHTVEVLGRDRHDEAAERFRKQRPLYRQCGEVGGRIQIDLEAEPPGHGPASQRHPESPQHQSGRGTQQPLALRGLQSAVEGKRPLHLQPRHAGADPGLGLPERRSPAIALTQPAIEFAAAFKRRRVVALAAILVAVTSGMAGPLEPPPGPVTATGRFGPRIDVATLAGDATATRVISQAGSYYMSGNLTGEAGKTGIRIDVNGVTLDLGGDNSLIINSVAAFNGGDGISAKSGVSILDNVATDNTGAGIRCGFECLVRGNTAQFNGLNISAPASTIIENHP